MNIFHNHTTQHGWGAVLAACLLPVFTVCAAPVEKADGATVQGKPSAGGEFLITRYGAKDDGKTLNTDAIQAAIDACHQAGGGTVVVPQGRFVTATLYLKDHVRLCLLGGAELLGSRNAADYPTDNPGSCEVVAGRIDPASGLLSAGEYIQALIVANQVANVAIDGAGTIDGRGQQDAFPALINGKKAGTQRPMLMRFFKCRNVRFDQVTLKNAASWGIHLVDCDDVHFQGITLSNRANRNNDGIDIDGCRNVFISDCNISTGDDAICPKSSFNKPCENVFIRNCILSSDTSGFKLGTSSRTGFKNIIVSDCIIRDTEMSAIKLICVDGGTMENIVIQNILMENVEGPLFIRLGDRGAPYQTPEPDGRPIPTAIIRDVFIRNIRATVKVARKDHAAEVQESLKALLAGGERTRSGILITGVPNRRISGLHLDHIEVRFPGMGEEDPNAKPVPEDEKKYPEQCFFGPLPSYGLFLRHAENIELSRIRFSYDGVEKRPAMVFEDVHDCTLKDGKLQADGQSVLRMKGVSDITVSGCKVSGKPACMIETDADGEAQVRQDNILLPKGTKPHAFSAR